MKFFFKKRSSGLLDKMICWWTGGPYYHVAMQLGDTYYEASRQNGSHQFSELDDVAAYDVIEVPMTIEQEAKIFSFLQDEMGCGYDWLGIAMAQVIGITWESKKNWFCSELAVAALQQTGYLILKKACRFSPNDLYHHLALIVSRQ